MATVCVLLILIVDIYILFDIRALVRRRFRTAATVIYGIFTLICWALAILVLVLPKRDAGVDILPAMWIMFILASVYFPQAVYFICSLAGRCVGALRKGRGRKAGACAGVVLASLMFVVMWWGVLFTRNHIVTNELEISSVRLPEAFDGYRVLQFSDAHVGTWGSDTTFMSRLVDSINACKPDLILFTGDLVNRQSSELDPFIPVLSRLRARDGVIAVHGNHDYASYVDWPAGIDPNRDVMRLDSLMRVLDWRVLNNATSFVRAGGDSIAVIGMENWGEPPFNQLGDLGASYPGAKGASGGLNDGMFKILLTHNPMYWRHAATKLSNVDLTLSGHTHAMQMMLKVGDWQWSPSKYRYPEWAGLYNDKAADGTPMNLYVNIGVGEVGFPARLFAAKPELTLFTLKREK